MACPRHRLRGVIAVTEYDPSWPQRFERQRSEYADAMAAAGVQVLAIEHVGSTSVPGLAAKPVIDIDIVVAEEQVAAASQVLIELGFEPEGELGIPVGVQGARAAGRDKHVRHRRGLALPA
jgi:GrpB-like predicted nucleotidyltransferase (UPF0157 family)